MPEAKPADDVRLSEGDVEQVVNQNPHPAANEEYNAALVVINGKKQVILLTDDELASALLRAARNSRIARKNPSGQSCFNSNRK